MARRRQCRRLRLVVWFVGMVALDLKLRKDLLFGWLTSYYFNSTSVFWCMADFDMVDVFPSLVDSDLCH